MHVFPKRLCLSTKRRCVLSHNNDFLLFTDMRTALLVLIACMVYVFLCTYVPAYIGMYYVYVYMYVCNVCMCVRTYVCLYVRIHVFMYVCVYICRYVYMYVILIALTALPCLFLIFLTSMYGRFTGTVPPSFIYKLGITFSASSFVCRCFMYYRKPGRFSYIVITFVRNETCRTRNICFNLQCSVLCYLSTSHI